MRTLRTLTTFVDRETPSNNSMLGCGVANTNSRQWPARNSVYSSGRIDSCHVREVKIDFDDFELTFTTETSKAQRIRTDVGITKEKLRKICDYLVTNRTSVTVYCVESGERRCATTVNQSSDERSTTATNGTLST